MHQCCATVPSDVVPDAHQELLERSGTCRVGRRRLDVDGVDGEPCTAVDAVALRDPSYHSHLEGTYWIMGRDLLGGPGQDAVSVIRGPDVELDTSPQSVDVGPQQAVVGQGTGRGAQGGRACRIPGRPCVRAAANSRVARSASAAVSAAARSKASAAAL